eukprot:CAMPEP_0197073008 /NCGR_PEP_ID=MMETSP1384-20130603/210385_1 /TAXON_ID=29189 /ORGANISM="Ammonia sp." /LENGTH=507 /DNA_ID=CAMNT_0042511833 /DNA_START=138 /DNA_END=1661 /DNA_ORIENTATION=+
MWSVNESQRKPTYAALTKCTTSTNGTDADHSLSLIQNAHIPKIQRIHTSDDVKTNIDDYDCDETETMLSGEKATKIDTVSNETKINIDGEKHAQEGDDKTTTEAPTPGTISSSVFNYANTSVGVGILAIPFALAQIGYVLSFVVLIICALLAAFAAHIQMLSAKVLRPKASYNTVCDVTIPKLRYFADFTVGAALFGASCAYLIVIGQLLPDIVRFISTDLPPFMYDGRLWIGIYFMALILPWLYCRSLSSLRHVSLFAMLCFLYLLGVIIYYYALSMIGMVRSGQDLSQRVTIQAFPSSALSFLKALPIFVAAFGFQCNCFGVVNELNQPNKARMNMVIIFTVMFLFFLYSLLGYCAYFTFGVNMPDNVLLGYPTDNVAVLIARIALSFAVAFSYPICFQPCKHNIASMAFGVANADQLKTWQSLLMITLMWISTVIVAMTVTDLGVTIAIIGCTGATSMIFILPGLFYIFMDHECGECRSVENVAEFAHDYVDVDLHGGCGDDGD